MNRILVLKSVAYATKQGGGKIANIKDINLLSQGALAFFSERGLFIDAVTAATVLKDSKTVQMAVGRSKDTLIVTLPRKGVNDINRVNYRAFTKPVVSLGNLSIVDTSEGEVFIRVSDISYTSRYNTRLLTASGYKRTNQTASAFIDSLVAKLNKASSWVVAAKTGAGPYKITVTPKDDGVALEIAMGGLIEGDLNVVTTAGVHGIGGFADILQMEKDFSTEEGNGNYTEYPVEFYSRAMQADATKNYDLITLSWEGQHNTPSQVKNVMHNRAVIACEDTAVADGGVAPALNQETGEIMSLLATIFATAFSGTTAAETATDTGAAFDGVAGN